MAGPSSGNHLNLPPQRPCVFKAVKEAKAAYKPGTRTSSAAPWKKEPVINSPTFVSDFQSMSTLRNYWFPTISGLDSQEPQARCLSHGGVESRGHLELSRTVYSVTYMCVCIQICTKLFGMSNWKAWSEPPKSAEQSGQLVQNKSKSSELSGKLVQNRPKSAELSSKLI